MVEAQRLGEDGNWATMWLYVLGAMLAGLATTGLGWLIGAAIR
jgi:fluoride ion exporter CrcB/FEX